MGRIARQHGHIGRFRLVRPSQGGEEAPACALKVEVVGRVLKLRLRAIEGGFKLRPGLEVGGQGRQTLNPSLWTPRRRP
jgi:hypothetical protein